MTTRGLWLGLLVVASGCAMSAQGQFPGAGDSHLVGAALQNGRLPTRGPVNASGKPMAFVVAEGAGGRSSEIIAFDLRGKTVLWRQPAESATRLMVGKSVVVFVDKKENLVGRDVATGLIRWEKPLLLGRNRVGFTVDGDDVYDLTQPQDDRSATRLCQLEAFDGATGAKRWLIGLPGEAGGPAARAGLVAVPRRSQYVTLIDGTSGRTLANILSREEAASFVKALPEGLFFGSRGVFLASAASAEGSRKGGAYLQAKVPAFVRPIYHWDMYRPDQMEYSALDRNRLLWRVSPGNDHPTFADGMVIVHTFRFFFGIDATAGTLKWAFSNPRVDVMASDDTGPSVVFVTADGAIGAIDAKTGRRTFDARLVGTGENIVIRGAAFDADGFEPAGTGVPEAEPPTLNETLAAIASDNDSRFNEVKVFAISELAHATGDDVTKELLKMLDTTENSPQVLSRAVDALVQRQDPQALDLYIDAIRVHPDYAEDKKPKRLDVFARAITGLKARQAIPALVDHLRLPDTDHDFVRDIADATLATEATEAVPAFEDFLLEYRADPAFQYKPGALLAACDVLIKLGGKSSQTILLYLVDEPKTLDPVRAYIQRSISRSAE